MSMTVARDPNGARPTELAEQPRPAGRRCACGDGVGVGAERAWARSAERPRRSPRHAAPPRLDLSEPERRLLDDLFAIVSEHAADSAVEIDRARVQDAFVFACEHHAAQRRKSGEDFIVHPVGVARICAGMRLDTETLCAALLHDTVEDTTASIEEVRERFGEEIAQIVDGVTKLTGITFQSHDEAQAENYRKMMVAMATDVRVILIKLADRLHNMRTIEAMPKQKQMDKARETLDIYAPLAHRLGIHAIKWELEDLAFATLHPRKYQEIKGLVAQQRDDREGYVSQAGEYLSRELAELGIQAQIAGRAKHFYSIYSKMTKKGREFNEIYDLTAMRVIVDSVKDCYGTVGVIHSLWKPLPGRFKDFIAMPKFNMYQSLHTTVIGPEGRPLEIQIRTQEMHEMAEFGVAAHWVYKQGPDGAPRRRRTARARASDAKLKWLRSMLDWQKELSDPREFMETLRTDLFEEEVFVFTPKGEVKSLAAGATPLDFAYEVHTEIGHRCVGARVNGKIVPLHYELRSGDIVEILTAKRERGPSRDWLAMVKTTRARNKIKAWFKAESRQDTEHTGRDLLQEHLRKAGPAGAEDHRLGDPRRRDPRGRLPQGRRLLHRARRGQGLAEARRQQGDAAPEAGRGGRRRRVAAADLLRVGRQRRRPTKSSGQYGIKVDGVEDVMLRLAKCCRPVPGDEIVGYISLGRGITIHREDCPNAALLTQGPRALHERRLGRRPVDGASSSKSRSTRGTATACWRISRVSSRSRARTSSKRAACRRRRWSRTASSSRSPTRTR